MKKLQKSVICGTHEQCTGALFTVDLLTIAGWEKKKEKKKKKKRKTYITKHKRQINLNLNGYYIYTYICIKLRLLYITCLNLFIPTVLEGILKPKGPSLHVSLLL